MPAGLLPYDVTAPYELIIKKLDDIGIEANCGFVFFTEPSSRFKAVVGGKVDFNCYLYMKDWSYRGVPPGKKTHKKINILVQIQEMIRRSDHVLTNSTVRVSYFDVNDKTAQLLQTVHFDYGPEQDCHPTFHAQITNEPLQPPPELIEQLNFVLPIQPSSQPWFNPAKIPTCDMTFPSVLLCLAADHLGPKFFNDYRKLVQSHHPQMPQPVFERLRGSIAAGPAHLRSSHWFPPMKNPEAAAPSKS